MSRTFLVALFLILAGLSLLVAGPVRGGTSGLEGTWQWVDTTSGGDEYWGIATVYSYGACGAQLGWGWVDQYGGGWSTCPPRPTLAGDQVTLPASTNDRGLSATWSGTIASDGQSISGTWSQSDGVAGTFLATRLNALQLLSDASWRFSRTNIPGWEELGFDDSGWGLTVANSAGRCGTYIGPMWAPNPISGETIFARKTFTLPEDPSEAVLSVAFDDDGVLFVNGNLVHANNDGTATGFRTFDIASYLHSGSNVFAIEATDSAGGCQSISVSSSIVSGAKPPPEYHLPFADGEAWKYSGGPHGPEPSSIRSGIDFAPAGGSTSIRATADGYVTYIGQTPGQYPFYCAQKDEWLRNTEIWIDHGDGRQTQYWHWSSHAWTATLGHYPGVLVAPIPVSQGEVIAQVGSVGCSTASHLHLERMSDGAAESWDERTISGWTVHGECSAYTSAPPACDDISGDPYNYGYIEKDGSQIIPGSLTLILSDYVGSAKSPPASPLESVGGTIGVSGGTVATGSGDSVEGSLNVPAGAVDGDTGITIDVFNLFDISIPAGAGEVFSRVFNFGPNGIQFNSPAELTVSYSEAEAAGMDEANLGAFVYNVLTGETELAEVTARDILSNVLTFELPHFSTVVVRDLSTSDFDGDGCTDAVELLNGTGDESLGGLRDALNPWDFYDVAGAAPPIGDGNPDGIIDLPNDILGVILHFAPQGQPPYDVQFDRGPWTGPNPWDMTAPDGVIDLPNDILGVILQFNHRCV